jgi:hypothetical protein
LFNFTDPSVYPFLQEPAVRNEDIVAHSQELLLHFKEFDQMGMRDDAEVIELDDIVHAADLTSGSHTSSGNVDHVFRPPSGRQECSRHGVSTERLTVGIFYSLRE